TNAGPGSPPRPGAACRRPDGFPPPGDIRTHPIAWCGNTCRLRFASTGMTIQPMESSTNCAYIGTTVPANSRLFHGRVRLSALFWAANCQSPIWVEQYIEEAGQLRWRSNVETRA